MCNRNCCCSPKDAFFFLWGFVGYLGSFALIIPAGLYTYRAVTSSYPVYSSAFNAAVAAWDGPGGGADTFAAAQPPTLFSSTNPTPSNLASVVGSNVLNFDPVALTYYPGLAVQQSQAVFTTFNASTLFPPMTWSDSGSNGTVYLSTFGNSGGPVTVSLAVATTFTMDLSQICTNEGFGQSCSCPSGVAVVNGRCRMYALLEGICVVLDKGGSYAMGDDTLGQAGCYPVPKVQGKFPQLLRQLDPSVPSILNGVGPFRYALMTTPPMGSITWSGLTVTVRSAGDPFVYALAASQGTGNIGPSSTQLMCEWWEGKGREGSIM